MTTKLTISLNIMNFKQFVCRLKQEREYMAHAQIDY